MKLTNNDHSHWQCSEDDEADHAQHYSKRGGEERERREGRREIIFMPRSHPLVGVTFNLDPPGQIFGPLLKNLFPLLASITKASQCMSAVLKTLRLSQHMSKMLVTFAHNWIAEMAERNAAKHTCDREQR